MTDSTDRLAWWAEGSWTGVATARAVMLLPPTVPQDLAERLWRLLRSEEASLTQALDELVIGMGGRLGSIPDFALAVSAPDDMMHVALRGSARLEVDGQALDASSVTTWLETAYASPRSVVARSPEQPGSVYRPAADAVVVAGALALGGDGDRGPDGSGGEPGQAASGAGEQDDDADPERAPADRLRRRSRAVSDQSSSRSSDRTFDLSGRSAGAPLAPDGLGAAPEEEQGVGAVSQDQGGAPSSAPDDADADLAGTEPAAADLATWAQEGQGDAGAVQEAPGAAGEAGRATQASGPSLGGGGTAEVPAQVQAGTGSPDSDSGESGESASSVDLAGSAAEGPARGSGREPGHGAGHGAEHGVGSSAPVQNGRRTWAEAWTGEWTGAMHRLVRSQAPGDLDAVPAGGADGRLGWVRPGVSPVVPEEAPATAATPSDAGLLPAAPVAADLPGSGGGQGEERLGGADGDVDGHRDDRPDGGAGSGPDDGPDEVADGGVDHGAGGGPDGSADVAPAASGGDPDSDTNGGPEGEPGAGSEGGSDEPGGAGSPAEAAAGERAGDHDGSTVSSLPEDLSRRLHDELVGQDEPAQEPVPQPHSSTWAEPGRAEPLSAGSVSQEAAPRVARARPFGDHDGHTVSGLPEDLVGELISLVGGDVPGPGAAAPVAPAPEPAPAPAPEPASVRVVLSAVCGNGHPNPTNYTTCRQCGADLNRPAKSVACPPLGRLTTSSGESIDLDRPVLVGRSPAPADVPTSSDVPVRVLTVPSPNQLVSRNHVLIDLDAWSVLAQDLGNCNGTVLAREGEAPVRLSSSAPVLLRSGDVLDVGDGQVLTFENLP